ncbi:MAG: hypothetical protein ACT4TC_00625 [Myxococcaceae bacterium]
MSGDAYVDHPAFGPFEGVSFGGPIIDELQDFSLEVGEVVEVGSRQARSSTSSERV